MCHHANEGQSGRCAGSGKGAAGSSVQLKSSPVSCTLFLWPVGMRAHPNVVWPHVQIEVKEGTKRRVTRLVKPLLERPRRRMPDIEAQRHSEAAVASRRHARIFRK